MTATRNARATSGGLDARGLAAAIDSALATDQTRWRLHALDRARDRQVEVASLRELLATGTVIERDDNRKPFPAAILLGTIGSRQLHLVVAWQEAAQLLHVITVYDPDVLHFDATGRHRRR
jgi:hypothetical protein